jgi:hypothetical protein
MSDENENGDTEKKSKDVTVEAEPAVSKATSKPAKLTVAFSANSIREKLDDGEYALSLILTSTRLENILTRGIKEKLELTDDEFESLWGRDTLGSYAQICGTLGVYGQKFDQSVIDDVVSLRNNLVHDYGYLSTIQEEKAERQEVEDAIDDAIEFIESLEL